MSEPQIRVFRADATMAGGCNACTRITATGEYEYRRVVVIELRFGSWRVCDRCLEALLPMLEDVRQ
jgi:hypothetical protein